MRIPVILLYCSLYILYLLYFYHFKINRFTINHSYTLYILYFLHCTHTFFILCILLFSLQMFAYLYRSEVAKLLESLLLFLILKLIWHHSMCGDCFCLLFLSFALIEVWIVKLRFQLFFFLCYVYFTGLICNTNKKNKTNTICNQLQDWNQAVNKWAKELF